VFCADEIWSSASISARGVGRPAKSSGRVARDITPDPYVAMNGRDDALAARVGSMCQRAGLAALSDYAALPPPPAPQNAPLAHAGSDQTVLGSTLITLDGSVSTDPNGCEITYRWTQIARPFVTLANSTEAQARFTAAYVASDTRLGFTLSVTDRLGQSLTVAATSTPPPPRAPSPPHGARSGKRSAMMRA
jgi:K319L-like, PKD domain